jgi:hypothetical protein
MDGLNEQASSYSDTIAQIVEGFDDEIADITNRLNNQSTENNNLFWDRNLIQDKTYEKVVQSWDENTGWYYNYDATIIKDIKQSFDVTYKGFPTLKIGLSNAEGKSKWVGTKVGNIQGKTFIIQGTFYSADTNPVVSIHLGSKLVWTSDTSVASGWTEINAEISINANDSVDTLRFTAAGNANLYFAPFFLTEKSLYSGLLLSDALNSVISYIGDVSDDEMVMPSIFPCVIGYEAAIYIDNLLDKKDFEDIHNNKCDNKQNAVLKDRYYV